MSASNKIMFSNLRTSPIVLKGRNGHEVRVVVNSTTRDNEDDIYFRLAPLKRTPSNDALACALATLCGKSYAEIDFDFPVSQEIVQRIKAFTCAKINAPQAEHHVAVIDHANRNCTTILNFSGGFDSLAAKALLPSSGKLVSMDFGGAFARETSYFTSYDPFICQTNFRALRYDRESWTFMGVGAVLFAEELDAGYNAFGTILEATPYQLRADPPAARNREVAPFSFVGLKNVCLTNGITEVGTCMMVTKFFPHEINASLQSLAAAGSEKQYRKVLLTKAVLEKFPRESCDPLDEFMMPKAAQAISFGKSFALDFLALYELKHFPLDVVSVTVCNIPQTAIDLVRQLKLTFYERYNTNFLSMVPLEWRADYLSALLSADIIPYDEQDWDEFSRVRKFLGQFYPILKS